jgi:homogentisate 1,2-dioxygenase
MDIPYIKGLVAKQAHVAVPDGTFEEEVGRNGFFGKYAHLYRAHSPVGWTRIEGALKPQAFDLRKLKPDGDYIKGRQAFLGNDDVQISFSNISEPMPYFFRNADADEILFVHEGHGSLETDYGPLTYTKGDYLVVPRGTVYRLAPQKVSQILLIESFSEVGFPDRGMLGQHALFDPAVVRTPSPDLKLMTSMAPQTEYELRIKRCGEITKVFYPFCPLDTVGWKSTRLNSSHL